MISYVFKCVQVMAMGGLWVAKVGFGRLKVVIGGYEWLSGVCVCAGCVRAKGHLRSKGLYC